MAERELTLPEILSSVTDAEGTPVVSPQSQTAPRYLDTQLIKVDNQVKDFQFNVDRDAIYDTNSKGEAVARFDNYNTAYNNENRLAKEQSGWEQAFNGLTKNLIKVGSYALDSTVGLAYGLYQGVSNGSMKDFWDNDFSRSLDDFNQSLDYSLANHYSDEEKSKSVLGSMLTVNFWANDVAGGLAFVGGALLPQAVMAVATGGASTPALIGTLTKGALKAGFKSATKSATKNLAKAATKKAIREEGTNFLRNATLAGYVKKPADFVKTAAFLGRSASFEAGMEARHNMNDAMSQYFASFESKNGRQPTAEEVEDFTKEATEAANGLFAANMAILSVSNAVMFGKTLGVGKATSKAISKLGADNLVTNNILKKAVGTAYKVNKSTGKVILPKANKLQKILGNTKEITGKALTEGLYEEGLQGVGGKTMQNYLEAKYNPKTTDTANAWSSFYDAMAEQYGTKEGWKEMSIGMIIGWGAGVFQGQGLQGIGKNSWGKKRSELEESAKSVNNNIDYIKKNMLRSNVMLNFSSPDQGIGKDDAESRVKDAEFIRTQEAMKSHTQIQKEFDTIVDNYQMTSEEVDSLPEGLDQVAYKQQLKDNFNQTMRAHKKATQVLDVIALDKVDETYGNKKELEEAIYFQTLMGFSAEKTSKDIAETLSTLIEGGDSAVSAINHYTNLSQTTRGKVDTLKKKRKELTELQNEAMVVATENRDADAASSEAEKVVLTANKVVELQTEVESLANEVDEELASLGIDLTGLKEGATRVTAEELVETMESLEQYTASLENTGRKEDAKLIEYLSNQYQVYSQAGRDMHNMARRMMDTNFFNGKEGKKFADLVWGKKYKMSDEFKQLIEDNDQIINSQLRKVGLRGEGSVVEDMQDYIENNPDLSEREKYRIESLVATQFNAEYLKRKIDETANEAAETLTETQEVVSVLEGDTLPIRITADKKDLTNTEILNNEIAELVNEVNKLRKKVLEEGEANQRVADIIEKKKEIRKLKKEVRELKRDDIYNNTDNQLPIEEKEQQIVNLESEIQPIDSASETLNELLVLKQELEEELEAINEKVNLSEEMDFEDFQKLFDRAEELENQIEETDRKIVKADPLQSIVDKDEYKRFEELTYKSVDEGLTAEEEAEWNTLRDSIDKWIYYTGAVVEGYRISDLIRQLASLKQEIKNRADAAEMPTKDILPDSLDTPSKSNPNLGLHYGAVTSSTDKDGNIILHNVSLELLESKIPGLNATLDGTNQRNVKISPQEVERINNETDIRIAATNQDMSTSYSVVLEQKTDAAGNTSVEPLLSDYNTGENFNNESIDENDIYGTQEGETLTLAFDPQDSYNLELKDQYDKGKITLEEFQSAAVVKVYNSKGEFVQILKRDRASDVTTDIQSKFKAARQDMITEEVIDAASKTGDKVTLETLKGESIKAKVVLVGHPNYNFEFQGPNVTVNSEPILNVEGIVDIGYVQNGKVVLRNKTAPRTSFIKKSIESNSNIKTPIVVVEKGKQAIALPIGLVNRKQFDEEGFRQVFNSDSGQMKKAEILNSKLAESGVDVNIQGNAFIGIGEGNLTQEFLEEKITQAQGVPSYANVEAWVDKNVSIEDSLVGNTTTKINIKDPVHSPKLVFNFEDINTSKPKGGASGKNSSSSAKKTWSKKGSGQASTPC